MKKKIVGIVAIGFITAAINFGIQKNIASNNMNETSLSNIEALAEGEIVVGPFCAYDKSFQCTPTIVGYRQYF